MIEHGQVAFEDLLGLVGDQERLWVRVAAACVGGTWTALAYDLVGPLPPPHWEDRTWRYPDAVFHAVSEDGPVVARWLAAGQISLDGLAVSLPGLPREARNHQVAVTGLASRQSWGGHEALPWPANSYELSSFAQPQPSPQDMLIACDSPSFLRFGNAVAAFFALNARQPGSQLPTPSVRLQDTTGRIARVTVHPVRVDVRVEGSALGRLTVELAGQVPGPQQQLSDEHAQEISLPTPDGLAPESWVLLKSGSDCVDRRFLNWSYQQAGEPADVLIAREPLEGLESLVAGGEGPTVEFKQQLPEAADERKKLCRTLAAFANGAGGSLLFGVDDSGSMVGVSAEVAVDAGKDTITRWISDLVAPHLDFSVESVRLAEGCWVVQVVVQEGTAPPYGVSPANPSYYLRRGATTFPASADDVRAMARARPPLAAPALGAIY